MDAHGRRMDKNIFLILFAHRCPVLFMTGSLASFNHTVYTLYNALQNAIRDQPSRRADVEIVEIDDVANVIRERVNKTTFIVFF